MLIEKDSGAFGSDALEGKLKLEAAIAAERAEDVAGKALRVNPDHGSWGGRSRMEVAEDESDQLFGLAGRRGGGIAAGLRCRGWALKAENAEVAPAGGEVGLRDLLCGWELHRFDFTGA